MSKIRARWPKYLVVPSEKQFGRSYWVSHECDLDMVTMEEREECERLQELANHAESYYGRPLSSQESEDLRYSCNTQCCLVGWAALAMGEEGCSPEKLKNPATAQFLNKFIELAGFEPTSEAGRSQKSYIENTALRASDLFEGEGMSTDLETGKSLSPRKARRLWIETAKHFGYDTDNMK